MSVLKSPAKIILSRGNRLRSVRQMAACLRIVCKWCDSLLHPSTDPTTITRRRGVTTTRAATERAGVRTLPKFSREIGNRLHTETHRLPGPTSRRPRSFAAVTSHCASLAGGVCRGFPSAPKYRPDARPAYVLATAGPYVSHSRHSRYQCAFACTVETRTVTSLGARSCRYSP